MTASILPYPAMPLLAEPPEWNAPEAPALSPETLGQSVLGYSINLYRPGLNNVLVMGGVHGDESEAVFLAHLLLRAETDVPVIPCLNPDGALLRQRWNARNADLNRNLPTADWQPEPLNPRYPPGAEPGSEPETQAFLAALERVRPSIVLSLHSYKESFVECERAPAEVPDSINAAVKVYTDAAGVPRKESIGYPTPGALGAFGKERGLLVFTYELRRGCSHGELHDLLPHFAALVNALEKERFQG